MKKLLLILLWLAAPLASPAAESKDDYFPFTKGRYWIYAGTVGFVENGKTQNKKLASWKSEVVDTFEGKTFKAARLKGHPGDLAWYSSGKKRGDRIYALTKDGTFLQVSSAQDARTVFAKIKAKGELPTNYAEPLFRVGLKEDDRFGDPETIKRSDRYCWVAVKAFTESEFEGVKGLPTGFKAKEAQLSYRSNPEHISFGFATNVGFTFFNYGHHGTLSECDMRLIETGMTKAASGK